MTKAVSRIDLCEYVNRLDKAGKTALLVELILELKESETIGMYWGPYVNEHGYEDEEEPDDLHVYWDATGEDLIKSIGR